MNRLLLSTIAVLVSGLISAQTNLLDNGSFESSAGPWTDWSSVNANGDLWGGSGNCNASDGSRYVWTGTSSGTSGVNSLVEDMYQTVAIPSNPTYAKLYFDASINTSESGSSAYDYMRIRLLNTSGSLLADLGYLSNVSGDAGITGCQTWDTYEVTIPSTYYGQTVRVQFYFTTDGSLPTIFRVDDVKLYAPTCATSLSTTSYSISSNAAATYNNIASVTASSGCSWTANVTSGSSWLSTSSSGTGNGSISCSVTQNTTGSPRSGTITVNGDDITVTQAAVSCSYDISPALYYCPTHESATLNNIAIVNTGDGCTWDANVAVGATWLVCNSDGTGSGTIDITVLENNSDSIRSSFIEIESETLTIIQPANPELTGVGQLSEASVGLFPNPTNGLVQITVDAALIGSTYSVYDLAGREVSTGTIFDTQSQMSIEAYPSGVYTFSLRSESETIRKRIIKTN